MLPKGWKKVPLHQVAEVRTGLAKGKVGQRDPVSVPYLRVANVQDGHFDLSEVKTIVVERGDIDRYSLRRGDVLMTEGGDFDKLGRGAVWMEQINPCLHQNHVFVVRPDARVLNPDYLSALSASSYGRAYFLTCAKRSTNLASINSSQLKAFPVVMPDLEEQVAMTRIMRCWDDAIRTAECLVENSRTQTKLQTQQLVLGRQRLNRFSTSHELSKSRSGLFPTDWARASIGSIAHESTKKNKADELLPVLSCTKHSGLVSSLQYFKKRVFSKDTTSYKFVPRSSFAYATNHIDERSIGYQDLYENALISPMYTVFSTTEKVVDRYIYKLLKTEHYRQIFAAKTNASVDRRGSLRWSDFKSIEIPLPSLEEQLEIARVIAISEMETEIFGRQLDRLKREKEALVQDLLTGKRRVRLPGSTSIPTAA